MYKFLAIVTAFVTCNLTLDAQVVWGPLKNLKSLYADFYSLNENNTLLFNMNREGFSMVNYNENLKMTQTQDVIIGAEEAFNFRAYFSKIKTENPLLVNNKLYIFSSDFNNKSKRSTAYLNIYDLENQKINKPISLSSIEDKFKNFDRSFDFILSEDSTKILSFYSMPIEKGVEKQTIKIYDLGMNILDEKEIIYNIPNEIMYVDDLKLLNDGSIIVLSKIYYKNTTEQNKKTPNFRYSIYIIDENSQNAKEVKLELEDEYVSNAKLLVDNNNIYCVGYYNKGIVEGMAGIFIYTIDQKTSNVVSKNKVAFTGEFKYRVHGKDLPESSISHIKIEQLLFNADNIILIGERNKVSFSSSRTMYFNGDIIVVSISKDGKFNWESHISKDQSSMSTEGLSSFAFAHNNDKLFFLYYDHKDNLNNNDHKRKKITPPLACVPIIATIDKNGSLEKKELNEGSNLNIRVQFSQQINPNELLIYARNLSQLQLGKLNLSEL